MRNDGELAIIATGPILHTALEVANTIDARLIDIHTIKPIDKNILLSMIKGVKAIITIEEHSIIGGLGGAISEILSEILPIPIKHIGINDTFGQSGSANDLLTYYQLDYNGILKQINKFIKEIE